MFIEPVISATAFAWTTSRTSSTLTNASSLSRRGLSSFNNNSEGSGSSKICKVVWCTSNGEKSLEVREGEILRTAALRRGISPHNGRSRLINCRGLGTCGTCSVEINGAVEDECSVVPVDRNTKERLRLNFPPHSTDNQSPNLRLACQVQVCGDLRVVKRNGFWGQNKDEMAHLSEAKLYFGDLEYILDDKSPDNKSR